MKNTILYSKKNPEIHLSIRYCDSFFCKLKGLMFDTSIDVNVGLLFSDSKESVINSSIHMLFMKFDIAVLWLDKNLQVCDKILAKKWHPAYFPTKPAQYVVEMHASRISDFSIGENLELKDH